MEAPGPQIHNYRDYRDYLSDWFKAGKAHNDRLSFRYIARHLGLNSPNHFHLVITKKRHLSKPTLDRLQKLLHLRPREKAYLDLLFALATEKKIDHRSEIEAKITRLHAELLESDVSYEQYALLANSLAWYLKMGALRFSGQTLAAIHQMVRTSCPFRVEESDVTAALELLEKIGATRRENDVYVFDLDNLKTEWDFDDKKIKQFHYNNLMLAMQTIPWPINRRFFSNVTIPANAALVEAAKKEIRDLCLKLLNLSNREINGPSECQQVLSLQFAMFPYFDFSDSNAATV